jgi:hypothetical protein
MMDKSAEQLQLAPPSLEAGWRIFATRPISLVAALVVATIVSLVSFLLLLFPAVAGYFYAVRESRREEYFIDLNNIARMIGNLFAGIKGYFWPSYPVGLLGIVFPLFLMVLPVLGWEEGHSLSRFRLLMLFLWIPACWILGSIILYGYPYMVIVRRGFASLRHGLESGRRHPTLAFSLGFLICFPITAFFFHLLMVFSYPILAGSALGIAAELGSERRKAETQLQEVTLGRLLLALGLAGVMVAALMFSVWLWGGVGFFIGLGFSFALAIFAHVKGLF